MMSRLLAAGLIVTVMATPAFARDGGGSDVEEDLSVEDLASKKARKDAEKDAKKKAKKKAKKDKEKERVRIGGRVFARVAVQQIGDVETADLTLSSARIEAKKRWRELTVAAEVELAGRVRLKDAFVRWRRSGFEVKGGQFKEPISAIELTSAFTLPTADRGILHDILTKRLGIAGRRPGAQVAWEGEGVLEPTFAIGVFQGTGGDAELIEQVAVDQQNVAARASVTPAGIEIGAFGELRAAVPVAGREPEHFWNAGLDVTWELELPSGALRVWADVMLGSSWRDYLPADESYTTFTSARLIAAFRFGGLDEGARYVEPFAQAGLFDPTSDFGSEGILEVRVGVNAGFWKIFRGTIEAQVDRTSRNQPTGLGEDGVTLTDRTAVIGQIAMVF